MRLITSCTKWLCGHRCVQWAFTAKRKTVSMMMRSCPVEFSQPCFKLHLEPKKFKSSMHNSCASEIIFTIDVFVALKMFALVIPLRHQLQFFEPTQSRNSCPLPLCLFCGMRSTNQMVLFSRTEFVQNKKQTITTTFSVDEVYIAPFLPGFSSC